MISDIQRFCIHDGPGIRTTVFFKGCPLRCAWCANPETQDYSMELMIKNKGCVQCGTCISACPVNALYMQNNKIRVDKNKCDLCGICTKVCPNQLLEISGKKLTAKEIIEVVRRDKVFYDASGGGMTLSGGEPLMQPLLAKELLKLAKNEGISTCIETCLQIPFKNMEDVVDYLDVIYVDFKHADPLKHKKYTGSDNQLIIGNLRKLLAIRPDLQVRIPVIPGFNDSEYDIKLISQTLKSLDVKSVELMQYHNLASSKYSSLNREYPYKDVPMYTTDHFDAIKDNFRACGLNVYGEC